MRDFFKKMGLAGFLARFTASGDFRKGVIFKRRLKKINSFHHAKIHQTFR